MAAARGVVPLLARSFAADTILDPTGRPVAGGHGSGRGAGGGKGDIVEVTGENFEAVVLRSPVPVILDMYADWCQPCKSLTPKLEQIVRGIIDQLSRQEP